MRTTVSLPFALLLALPLGAQAPASDSAVLARIRDEGTRRSRVVETAVMLSDVLGPRLAGSPEYREAAEWARAELERYGLRNAALEPWGRRRGRSWSVARHSIELVSPRYQRIRAFPRAWSPPTAGVVRGTPVVVDVRADSDVVKYRGKLRGAIVMNGGARFDTAQARFEPHARRFTGAQLDSLARLTDPGDPKDYCDDACGYAENVRRRLRVQQLLREEGVAALLEPSRNRNAVMVSGYQAYDSDVSGAVPGFFVDRSDYDRIVHLVEAGRAPVLELSLETRSALPAGADTLGYNVVAELPGSDPALAAEVVMVGGHFDSWTAGTGATDNAAGVAAAMEALRILQAVGARPRRTLRIAMWDGEEHEDYFGSLGYVRKHFGDPETRRMLPENARVSAYFNLDNGTGAIRGVYLQGNARARPVLASVLAPLADLGATTLTIKRVGSTDHVPFWGVGIPAFTFIQDPIDYEPLTHHTEADDASNLMPADLRQASIVLASVLYQVANLPEKLPRVALPAAPAPATR
jgi:carboxypeptidase Q